MLSNTYSKAALSEMTYLEQFQRLESGVFDVEDRHGDGKKKIFENSELKALLAQDSWQTQKELAESLGVTQEAILKRLKAKGMIEKRWHTAWLISISALMKKSKNGSNRGSP